MNMFVAVSTYLKPLNEVDAKRAEHLQWVEARYARGDLLVSGRREPPVGGILVGQAENADGLRALLSTDPFVIDGISDYDIKCFTPTPAATRSPGFAAFAAHGEVS